MSHLKERKEKNCLNCNAVIYGKYCHICGQENIEPKESAWHLITHFFQDITHFDGKFFTTLKLLITRPGFVSAEYVRGRRASYLNPVRMYIFSSAFFFLIFFSLFHVDDNSLYTGTTVNGKSLQQVDSLNEKEFADFTANVNKEDGKGYKPMTRQEFSRYVANQLDSAAFYFNNVKVATKKDYDDSLAKGVYKHGWIEKQMVYLTIRLNEKYRGNLRELTKALSGSLLHSLPQLLFISLPLFALLLKLLYIRRKQFYYVSHGIFTIHYFILAFIVLLGIFGLNSLISWLHWGWLGYLRGLMIVFIFWYCYRAMRNFYGQGKLKTFTKFFILQLLNAIMIGILFVFFFIYSLFKL